MNYRDPVCGMTVNAKQAEAGGLKLEHGGQTYYFCSLSCKETFRRHAEDYAKPVREESRRDHGRHCC